MVLSRSASSLNAGPIPVARSAPLRNDHLGIQFSRDYRDLCFLHVQLGEDLLRYLQHPFEVAVAARHSAAAEDHRSAGLLPGFDHVAEIRLHGVALEILVARTKVVRASVHRTAIGNDGINTPLQRFLQ